MWKWTALFWTRKCACRRTSRKSAQFTQHCKWYPSKPTHDHSGRSIQKIFDPNAGFWRWRYFGWEKSHYAGDTNYIPPKSCESKTALSSTIPLSLSASQSRFSSHFFKSNATKEVWRFHSGSVLATIPYTVWCVQTFDWNEFLPEI